MSYDLTKLKPNQPKADQIPTEEQQNKVTPFIFTITEDQTQPNQTQTQASKQDETNTAK